VRCILFNKPDQVLPSFTDPDGRATLADFIDVPGVYAAGRLDYDSEGLLVLTDDGGLIHRLTDPRHEHPKTYWVQVEGVATAAQAEALARGVVLRGERTRPAEARLIAPPEVWPRARPVRGYHPTSWLELVLREGKKRQVRRMTAAVGLPALRLIRVAVGPLRLGALAPGAWRDANDRERRELSMIGWPSLTDSADQDG
jgi:23S rRNA pseudouridine2457 synthase